MQNLLLIALALLAAQVVCVVNPIPFTSTATQITNPSVTFAFDFDHSTATDDYINVYYNYTIDLHSGSPAYSRAVFSYAEILFNGAAPVAIDWSNIGNKLMDQNGFLMLKDQLISIKKSDYTANLTVGSNLTVQVTVFVVQPTLKYDINAYVIVNTSMTKPCPSNCSNRGQCSNGTCSQCGQFSGYDCSVRQKEFQGDNKFNLAPAQFVYARYDVPESKPLALAIGKNDEACGQGLISVKFDNTPKYSLLSIFEGSGKDFSGNIKSASYSISSFQGTLYFTFLNFGSNSCQMQIILNQNSINVLLIIMIVLGSAILIALIVGIIYIIKKRRDFARIRPNMGSAANIEADYLTKQQIERYFPPVISQFVMNVKQRNQSSLDLNPSQDCVICLCPIQRSQTVRITYCNHLFHKDCLSNWLNKVQSSQNCPYCREDFSKSSVKELYERVRDFARQTRNNKSLELQGNELAAEIVEYHKKRSVPKEESTIQLPKRRGVNIESLQ